MVHLSFLSLDCTYWYIWIAAIYKKANKLFFFFLIWKKSHLEATGRRSVSPTKTATFPVLYFEASHSMYFLLRPKLCSRSLPCVWHCCMRCLVWLQGWTVNSVTPVPQSRRDLLQAMTEGLVFPTGLSTTQLGCAGACTVAICIPLQDLAISMLVTFIVQQQPLLTSLGPGQVLQNSCWDWCRDS